MASREDMRNRLDSAREVSNVVGTMKVLAAASIREYRRASEAFDRHVEILEASFQAASRRPDSVITPDRFPLNASVTAVVYGSDQGMCGSFNQRIADRASEFLRRYREAGAEVGLLVAGRRLRTALPSAAGHVAETFETPTSIDGVGPHVQNLALRVQREWESGRGQRIVLLHHVLSSALSSEIVAVQLYPLDQTWLSRLRNRPWDSRRVPMLSLPWPELLSGLVRHYLFIMLHRAATESLASESANRLRAMQAAERNIEERLAKLRTQWQRERQARITRELLDVVAGYESSRET